MCGFNKNGQLKIYVVKNEKTFEYSTFYLTGIGAKHIDDEFKKMYYFKLNFEESLNLIVNYLKK